MPVPFRLNTASTEHQLTSIQAPEIVQEQEKSQSAFRNSPDWRTVNLRGEEFYLTFPQSQIVEALWDAYAHGTPDLSESYLLSLVKSDENRSKYRPRLKDTFKRLDNWHNLIVAGQRKDTVRLNIDV